LRLRLPKFTLDLLQLWAVCLSNQEKSENLKEADDLSASAKKTKAAQMIIASDGVSPSGLIWMVMIIAVHMMHYLQYCMKFGPLTQRYGQGDSKTLISTSQNTVFLFQKIYEWSSQL